MQMEWEGTPLRRSSRLHIQSEPNKVLSNPPSNPKYILPTPQELPDLGPGVELYQLPDTDVGFNIVYLNSQDRPVCYYSSQEDFADQEDSDTDIERGKGLEDVLWPPEVLMQARNFGPRRQKRTCDDHDGGGDQRAREILQSEETTTVQISDVWGPVEDAKLRDWFERQPYAFVNATSSHIGRQRCAEQHLAGSLLEADDALHRPNAPVFTLSLSLSSSQHHRLLVTSSS